MSKSTLLHPPRSRKLRTAYLIIWLCLAAWTAYTSLHKQNPSITQVTPTASLSPRAVAAIPTASPEPLPQTSPTTLGSRTKTSACQINGALPDLACTPGAGIQGLTKEQVCASGYSSSVRNVGTTLKDAVYAEYGITSHAAGQYEVDHYVSLEVGGSNDIANLWPEPASPVPGFHEKDRVEGWLHERVCDGTLTLEQAQEQEVGDWVTIYNRIEGTNYPDAYQVAP